MAGTQGSRALDLLKAKGMLRLRDFIAEGIEPETLAGLARDAKVSTSYSKVRCSL